MVTARGAVDLFSVEVDHGRCIGREVAFDDAEVLHELVTLTRDRESILGASSPGDAPARGLQDARLNPFSLEGARDLFDLHQSGFRDDDHLIHWSSLSLEARAALVDEQCRAREHLVTKRDVARQSHAELLAQKVHVDRGT